MPNDQNDLIKDILKIPAENQTIEFKRLTEDKVVSKIIETVVAMTNTDGRRDYRMKLDQIGFWFEIKLEKEKHYNRLIIRLAERRD